MSFQSARVRNLVCRLLLEKTNSEAMHVVADSASYHGTNDERPTMKRDPQPLVRYLSIRNSFVIRHSNCVIHRYNFRLMTPLNATILYLSFMSARGRRSTVPPAFSTSSHPAAMSQRLIPCSM